MAMTGMASPLEKDVVKYGDDQVLVVKFGLRTAAAGCGELV